ncbi:Fe-S cluster assembly protein SufD [bacterium]|nr:Fe-S cluster assembly protein SufD [bacterium]
MSTTTLKSAALACQTTDFLAKTYGEPEWSAAKRKAGLLAARHLATPTHKDEAWRLSFLEHFALPDYYINPYASFAESDGNEPSADDAAKLAAEICAGSETPANFSVIGAGSSYAGCPAGITGLSMSAALAAEPSLESFFFLDQRHQRDYYGALNAAWRNGGAWLDVPRDTATSGTIKIEHVPQSAVFLPHSVLRLESGSQASVIEHFRPGCSNSQSVPTIEINLAENSSLQYALVLDWEPETFSLVNVHVYMQEGSNADIFLISLGGLDNKVFFQSDIAGANASSQVYGLTYAKDRQNFEINLLQKHHTGHSKSDVLYHCALDGEARSIFAGNIDVCGAAQKSDAYQKNRNLLLSPRAHAYSQPQLEIIADDVRCTHGANFTSYDPEQEFYLQSRGIRPEEARRLIVSGFLHEITGHFRHDPGRFYLGQLLNSHLGEEWLAFSDEQAD